MLQAVPDSSSVVWFSWIPEFDIPGGAVCPLPNALLLYVVASKINIAETCSIRQPLVHILFGGIGGDRGQVSTFILAEVFGINPVLLVSAPKVAVVAILLPVMSAGINALVSAAF